MQTKYLEVDCGSLKIKFFPLNLRQLQELEDDMQALNGVAAGENPFNPERFARLVRIYTASAQRGDPAITTDMVASAVDLDNIADVNRAVLGQFGKPPVSDSAGSSGATLVPTRPPNGAASMPV